MRFHHFDLQVGVFKVNFTKQCVVHSPSGLKINVNFLKGGDGWTIDQNYSTKSAKIRNSSGFSQQLSGLFLAQGIHLPKVGGQSKPPATMPVAATVQPPATVGAPSDSADEYSSHAENDSATRRPSGQKQRQDSSVQSGKPELVKCSDGHFRLQPKKNQMSNSGNSASEQPALMQSTPPPKKRRDVHDAGSRIFDSDGRLKQSATKQTPPVARRRLFDDDGEQSDGELHSKQEAEQNCRVNFKTDRPKTRRNSVASTRQDRDVSPDPSAFAGAHPKSKPRCPVAAVTMNAYSGSSDDEFNGEVEEG